MKEKIIELACWLYCFFVLFCLAFLLLRLNPELSVWLYACSPHVHNFLFRDMNWIHRDPSQDKAVAEDE